MVLVVGTRGAGAAVMVMVMVVVVPLITLTVVMTEGEGAAVMVVPADTVTDPCPPPLSPPWVFVGGSDLSDPGWAGGGESPEDCAETKQRDRSSKRTSMATNDFLKYRGL